MSRVAAIAAILTLMACSAESSEEALDASKVGPATEDAGDTGNTGSVADKGGGVEVKYTLATDAGSGVHEDPGEEPATDAGEGPLTDPGEPGDSGSEADTVEDVGSNADEGSDPGADPGSDSGADKGGGSSDAHPAGWTGALAHGRAVLQGENDCRSCHGADLGGGGAGVGCDGCHEAGWRSDCTFCHGGVSNDTGAPPEGLGLEIRFPHTAHVQGPRSHAYDCVECHAVPESLLAAGHIFDDTPGRAEVDLSGGISPNGQHSQDGACSSLYCHGSGKGDDGSITRDSATPACDGCHPSKAGGSSAWESMSGDHRKHLNKNIECADCHGSVVSGSDRVITPDLHVNGAHEIQMPAGIVWSGGRCTGLCHWKGHSERW